MSFFKNKTFMKVHYKNSLICSVLKRIRGFPQSRFQIRCFSEDTNRNLNEKFNPFRKKIRKKYLAEPKTADHLCITILGNGAVGQPRCVALFTDLKAFIFNCGEGVGRLCREYEIQFSLLRHFFITQNKWKNLSGLADVYITNNVCGLRSSSIYGPPGVEYCTNLVTANGVDLKLVKRISYQDEILEITHIPIQCPPSKSCSKFSSQETNADVVYSYVCKIFKRLGSFNPEKSVDLGVPFGPHLLKLKNGEDVVLPDGRVIYSSDVLDSPQPAITFLVVDCPSERFLDAFVNEEQFSEYHLPIDNASDVKIIFHFSPDHIIKSRKYQTWMQKFHQSSQHYILNSSNPTHSSAAINQTQNILNLLHPKIFKLLPSDEKIESLDITSSVEIVHPPPMLQIHLRPNQKLGWNHVISYNSENYNEMFADFPVFKDELSKLKYCISSLPLPDRIDEYPEVIFLGTCSSTSTAFRNVSSILVNISSSNSILLDCGEGTLLQLVRYFGKANIDTILQNISCVFITHKHTDHYLGLFELLNARKEAFEKYGIHYKPIALILPFMICDILNKYCEIFGGFDAKCRVFPCKHLSSSSKKDYLRSFVGDVTIQTVPVIHCADAYGIVLQLGSKWKIVYSGDTSPCRKLVEAGENCTLLIHEASIENNLASEASYKLHSTPSQVVEVAESMNAQYTIMTHFSKRYLAVPPFPESDKRAVGYAFDFMKVRLHDLPLLPLFLPALRCLFQEQLHTHLEKSTPVAQSENFFLKRYRSLKAR